MWTQWDLEVPGSKCPNGWAYGPDTMTCDEAAIIVMQRRIQRSFATGQPVWDPKFLSQINKKLQILMNLILI